MRTPSVATSLCALLLAAACAPSARFLHRTPTGGTILLEGNPDTANRDAAQLMTAHCPGGYQLLGDKERMIGTEEERRQMAKLQYECKPRATPAPAPATDAAASAGDAGPGPGPG
jgi:hypothetical protein